MPGPRLPVSLPRARRLCCVGRGEGQGFWSGEYRARVQLLRERKFGVLIDFPIPGRGSLVVWVRNFSWKSQWLRKNMRFSVSTCRNTCRNLEGGLCLPFFSMPDMNSITDETGIDAQVCFSSYFRELVGMVKSGVEVGVSQLPPALTLLLCVMVLVCARVLVGRGLGGVGGTGATRPWAAEDKVSLLISLRADLRA